MKNIKKEKSRINPNKLSDKQFDILKSLLIAIVSGFSVVLFQQLFFKSNVDYELRKEILKENYEYYVAIQNFTDLNNYTEYHFVTSQRVGTPKIFIDPKSNDTIKIDTIYGYKDRTEIIRLPSIAVDSKNQEQWIADKEYIELNKNKIDQDIYLKFNEIVTIVEQNPWPETISIESLNENIWSTLKFEHNWFKKNMTLNYKVSEIIELK